MFSMRSIENVYSANPISDTVTIYGKNDNFSKITKKIKDGELKVAVYGLGHVGSPIAAVWLRAGAHVIVTDKSAQVLENAKKGQNPCT